MKKAEALKLLNEITLREIGTKDSDALRVLHGMLADLMGGGYDFYSDSMIRNTVRDEYNLVILNRTEPTDPRHKAAKVITDFISEVEKQELIYKKNTQYLDKLCSVVQEEMQMSRDEAEAFNI